MHRHSDDHHHHHDAGHGHGGDHGRDAELGDLLDLDAQVHGDYLDDVTGWASPHVTGAPGTVVDVGAGTGAGSLALARHFKSADVVAVDKSAVMLERLLTAARDQDVADRLRLVRADLDVAWPDVGTVDVAWAASFLHEVTEPDRVLRDIYAALVPGGLLVVTELDSLPRFLPEDAVPGRPGLEARWHEALAQLGWNAHPDWLPQLERAGFQVVDQRTFSIEAKTAEPSARQYAHTYLRHMRPALDGQLVPEDLDALDRLLADDNPHGVAHNQDSTIRGSRTAWAARRPATQLDEGDAP